MSTNDKIYFDDYEFLTTDPKAMHEELERMHDLSEWLIIPSTKDIRIWGFNPMDICSAKNGAKELLHLQIASMLNVPENNKTIIEEQLDETAHGTKLLGSLGNNGTYMFRPCAITSLYESAKINGSALKRLMIKDPNALAEVLNICLQVATGSSVALIRAGKTNAVLSNGYVIMDTLDVFETAERVISSNLGTVKFIQGYNSHAYTSAYYALPDIQDEFLNKYADALSSCHLRSINYMPVIRISTSDTGYSAATVSMYFRRGNSLILFGKPIKVEHRNRNQKKGGLDVFEEACSQVYSKFNENIETIAKMEQTIIYHPINAILNFGKKVNLPQKYVAKAVEIHKMFGDSQCSMHDVYLSIYDGFADVENHIKRVELEELVCRILSLDWTEYDTVIPM